MRNLAFVGLLGLAGLGGCANFCDRFFRARNVCRDQAATPAVVAAPAPVVMQGGSTVMSPGVVIQGCDCACSCAIGCVSGYAGPVVFEPAADQNRSQLHPFRWMFPRRQNTCN